MKFTRILIINIFVIIVSSTVCANCIDHKVFVYNVKQQLDVVCKLEKKKNFEYILIKLQEIIRNNLNLEEISRFVMGKYWALTLQEERENFLREYEIYFTRLCGKILYNYISGSEMTIIGSKAVDERVCLVSTRFSRSNEEFTNIDFKIVKNNSSFLINDIVMNGISISVSQRSKFTEKTDIYGIVGVINELKFNNNL